MSMKYRLIAMLALLSSTMAWGQQYNMVFKLDGVTDSVMYIARHYADQLQMMDSARRGSDGSYHFAGKRQWTRGIYALVGEKRDKAIGDFAIDGSQQFTISSDSKLTPSTVTVKGSYANEQIFKYMANLQSAQKELEGIQARKKNPATKAAAEKEEETLNARMKEYTATALNPKKPVLFFDLVRMMDVDDVPEGVADKAYYYRTHYWDQVDLTDHSLVYTPHLFNKMNRFFFGMLYRADSDTIIKEVDRLMDRLHCDTLMMRYVLEYITPRYFRSTKNVGWDAVWCHIAERYYLAGRCPWASEGTIHNTRYNFERIRQSIIGAHGQELWMADTNQSDNPEDWISSHRFPEKYVILWFWDPDCHHCQQYSAELKVLYDSLKTAPDRRFEVYAVGYESDVAKWKRYIREHQLPFVNVGGTFVNVDYQEAYNVHSAPTMIILNEKRDIIMNKLIPIKSILGFLDNYERLEAKRLERK